MVIRSRCWLFSFRGALFTTAPFHAATADNPRKDNCDNDSNINKCGSRRYKAEQEGGGLVGINSNCLFIHFSFHKNKICCCSPGFTSTYTVWARLPCGSLNSKVPASVLSTGLISMPSKVTWSLPWKVDGTHWPSVTTWPPLTNTSPSVSPSGVKVTVHEEKPSGLGMRRSWFTFVS